MKNNKYLNSEVWRNLSSHQKINLSMMLLMLVALPVAVFVALGPTRLFSRAFLPVTPPVTSTSTPFPTPVYEPTLVITTEAFIDGFEGESYRNFFYAEARGYRTDPVLTLTAENLPPGLSVPPALCGTSSPEGTPSVKRIECALDGTPATAGFYSINIVVSDNEGRTVNKVVFLRVTRSGTPTPTPRLVLNSASGKSCSTLCSQVGLQCRSVGTDLAGTNGKSWQSYKNSCAEILTSCDGSMKKSGNRTCSGNSQPWTYCKCN